MSAESKLKELGWSLPNLPPPAGAYVPAVRTGNLVYTAGQIPTVEGKLLRTGKVGKDVTLEDAQKLARQCVLNALAALRSEVGSLDRVKRIVRIGVFVASATEFTEQAKVGNGASETLLAVFGDAGRHARTSVGVNVLPLDAPVEVEVVAEVV
ncbi:MAG: RidA family protein [Thermoplasmatota archaeon]